LNISTYRTEIVNVHDINGSHLRSLSGLGSIPHELQTVGCVLPRGLCPHSTQVFRAVSYPVGCVLTAHKYFGLCPTPWAVSSQHTSISGCGDTARG